MKTPTNRSIIISLFKFLNILWILELTGYCIFIIIAIITGRIRGAYAMPFPISFEDQLTGQLYPKFPGLRTALIHSQEGHMSIQIAATIQNFLLVVFGYGMIFLVVIFITYQVKEVFKNLNNGSIFQLNNLLRVKKIAIILIAYTIGNFLYSYIINEFLYSHYHIRSLELKYQLNMVTFTCGIVLLLTAQTFKVGILLEEENKLTI